MSIPVWVHIHWSESRKFGENELMPFIEFERRAEEVAISRSRNVPAMQSYTEHYKTMANVLFDDGNSYECRLDLALRDRLGFKDHALRLIDYYERQQSDSYVIQTYKANYEFLKQVNWP